MLVARTVFPPFIFPSPSSVASWYHNNGYNRRCCRVRKRLWRLGEKNVYHLPPQRTTVTGSNKLIFNAFAGVPLAVGSWIFMVIKKTFRNFNDSIIDVQQCVHVSIISSRLWLTPSGRPTAAVVLFGNHCVRAMPNEFCSLAADTGYPRISIALLETQYLRRRYHTLGINIYIYTSVHIWWPDVRRNIVNNEREWIAYWVEKNNKVQICSTRTWRAPRVTYSDEKDLKNGNR